MEKSSYTPRFLLIVLIAVIVGQFFSFNYLKQDFEKRISECYDAINTSTIMQGALVNILVEKDVFKRERLLEEAEKLSTDLKDMMEKVKQMRESTAAQEKPELQQPQQE